MSQSENNKSEPSSLLKRALQRIAGPAITEPVNDVPAKPIKKYGLEKFTEERLFPEITELAKGLDKPGYEFTSDPCDLAIISSVAFSIENKTIMACIKSVCEFCAYGHKIGRATSSVSAFHAVNGKTIPCRAEGIYQLMDYLF